MVFDQRPLTAFVRSFPIAQVPGFCCVEVQLVIPVVEAGSLIQGLLAGHGELVLENADVQKPTTYQDRALAIDPADGFQPLGAPLEVVERYVA
jgi:hypothetical protein